MTGWRTGKRLKGEGSYRSWAVELRCDDSCSVLSLPSPVIAQSTKDKELNTQGEGHLQRMASWMPWPQQVIRRQCSPVLKRSIHCDRPLRVQSLVHVWQRCWTAAQPSRSLLYSQLLGLSFVLELGVALLTLLARENRKVWHKVLRIRLQTRLELDPLKIMLTCMDFIGGGEACQSLCALLFSSLHIVRLYYCAVGSSGAFDWGHWQ